LIFSVDTAVSTTPPTTYLYGEQLAIAIDTHLGSTTRTKPSFGLKSLRPPFVARENLTPNGKAGIIFCDNKKPLDDESRGIPTLDFDYSEPGMGVNIPSI